MTVKVVDVAAGARAARRFVGLSPPGNLVFTTTTSTTATTITTTRPLV
jgi:hypothetical protein